MQTIDTGYKPEFGLGALYAGQNAANSQAMNDEELAKLFLANQTAQQSYGQVERTNPLEVTRMQNANTVGGYDAALARAKQSSPSYIPMSLSGQEAQMQNQMTSADTGKLMAPFVREQTKATAQADTQKQQALWTLQNIDSQLNAEGGTDAQGNIVKFTPGQIGFMKQKRQEIADQLKSTPEFLGKESISAEDNATKIQIAEIQAAAARDAAASRAAGVGNIKPPKTAEEALIRQIANQEAAGEITAEEAQKQRAEIEAAKRAANRAPGTGLVPDGKGGWTLAQQEKVPAYTPPASNTPAPKAETKEVNGVTYIKVPGGWKKQ